LWVKFREGCVEKGLLEVQAEEMWDKFEYFSGYGFNKSHAVSYCLLSFQCAWLFNYHPECWMAAFLDKEPDTRKEKAINIAKSYGFEIEKLNINTSGTVWEISEDGETLIQPLTSIKGLGIAAIQQILDHRPFSTVEEFLFNEDIVYGKLNKKALCVLARSQSLDPLMDNRFEGLKHFWSSIAVERPRKEKNLLENIEVFRNEPEFTEEEKIQHLVDLTGVFPMELVLDEETMCRLDELAVPPLSEYDAALQVAWFVPREVIKRKSSRGKDYYVIKAIDTNSEMNVIRCWGVDPKRDRVYVNRPYMAKLKYDPDWGFSTFSIRSSFKLLG
ncbi:hypothetical protein CL634_10930, partial [bacterium]|nr:hypothetical protein [bacterium]